MDKWMLILFMLIIKVTMGGRNAMDCIIRNML